MAALKYFWVISLFYKADKQRGRQETPGKTGVVVLTITVAPGNLHRAIPCLKTENNSLTFINKERIKRHESLPSVSLASYNVYQWLKLLQCESNHLR